MQSIIKRQKTQEFEKDNKPQITLLDRQCNIASRESGKGDHTEGEATHKVSVDGREYEFKYIVDFHWLDCNTYGEYSYYYRTDGDWQACPGKRTHESWVSGVGANPSEIDGMTINLGSGLRINGQSV